MRKVLCNQCLKQAEADRFGLPPEGWLAISLRDPKYPPPADYCSIACAQAGLQAQADADAEVALKAEVA